MSVLHFRFYSLLHLVADLTRRCFIPVHQNQRDVKRGRFDQVEIVACAGRTRSKASVRGVAERGFVSSPQQLNTLNVTLKVLQRKTSELQSVSTVIFIIDSKGNQQNAGCLRKGNTRVW